MISLDEKAMWQDYYLALGQFMQCFGLTERELAMQLSSFIILNCLKLPPELQEIPYALLGSRRMAQLCDAIKSIAKITSIEKPYLDDIEKVTAQLGEIRFLRDQIAHNGVLPDIGGEPGWFYVDNVHNAGDYEKIRHVSFKAEHLKKATIDLGWCGYRISHALRHHEAREDFLKRSARGTRGKERGWRLNPTSRPWQYKPRELRMERTSWRRENCQGLAQKS